MDEKVQKVLDYIEEHKEEYLELLLRFCRQPSVAATGEGIEKMAGMVVDELKKLGVEPTVLETGGSPFIYGEIKGEVDRTFGFYDHYDVQPVDPIDEWITRRIRRISATASFMPAAWPTTKTALSPACVRWMHGRKCTASCR